MELDSDEALHFPESDTIPELPSDDSFDELMLKPLIPATLMKGMNICTQFGTQTLSVEKIRHSFL
jgi:hypothetical protein